MTHQLTPEEIQSKFTELNLKISTLAELVSNKEHKFNTEKLKYESMLNDISNSVTKLNNSRKTSQDVESGMVLVDAEQLSNLVELVNSIRSQSMEVNDKSIPSTNTSTTPPPTTSTYNVKKSNSKNKKGICSYCSQIGHKRSECPLKLYGETNI
ncbi:hypothetical protein CANARDRAFT_30415 [[Candida] arabinofermentans NRRL YB-2248]|uniref:CCHC-type domain-containing protein n=1 Tax=[Candida] arabinofermentans NRRL YB-2248 TaxID=983967 RepID=A0A1E4STW2_9ASCO|nr:hypothetical protein CANARDRAFT_30415 [[Candida] arabinofermentans NRRL YB-2248]